jgi:hypothetical protein
MEKDVFTLRAHGVFNYISEDYGEYWYYHRTATWTRGVGYSNIVEEQGTGETKATFMELVLGLVAAYDIEHVRLFGAIDVLPYQTGKTDDPTGQGDDLKRSDIVVGRLGVQYAPANSWWIRGEVSFIGETGVSIGTGVSF